MSYVKNYSYKIEFIKIIRWFICKIFLFYLNL